MKVCVVGIGYVGMVTSCCLADAGNDVVCVDVDEKKIENLKKGIIPIYEPGLTEIMTRNEKLGRLRFTTDLKYGVHNSRVIFMAVGTPSLPDGSADISAILSVAGAVGEYLTDYRVLATKSTVPVGTHKKVIELVSSKTDVAFDYVSNPEFLKEGSAVEDFMRPERVIIGTLSERARSIMNQLYSPFMRRRNRIIFMDPVSAEMTKYAANTMLATRISFMNEIAALCEKIGANIEQVRRGIGSDSRIGPAFIFPGIGYGGSCFPKDIRALIYTGAQNDIDMTMGRTVQHVNIQSQQRFTKRIRDYFAGREEKTVLATWGLAFKAKTDDIRESPAIYCIQKLLDCGIRIRAYDPEAMPAASQALKGEFETYQNGYDALDGADALVVFTDWQEFRTPDFTLIAEKLNRAVIFDGRNLYDPQTVAKAGIEYHSIGRASVMP